jgi:hypothetical protein
VRVGLRQETAVEGLRDSSPKTKRVTGAARSDEGSGSLGFQDSSVLEGLKTVVESN